MKPGQCQAGLNLLEESLRALGLASEIGFPESGSLEQKGKTQTE